MIHEISFHDFVVNYSSQLNLIDVRSPGEFEKGHVPGATNVALFSNHERAHVGTVYVQQSREEAIEVGYTYVNPKLQFFIDEGHRLARDNKVAVHCWRGGMRSRSFAEHLEKHGFEVYLIKKGYKAFRNLVIDTFDLSWKLNILGGYTGSGKTVILQKLSEQGEQVVDLEGLAHHKGSSFGSLGEEMQPTTEQFENNLYWIWKDLDIEDPIWLEDESKMIGRVDIPQNLFKKMRESQVYFLDVPIKERTPYLTQEYACFDKTDLANAVTRIRKKLGGAAFQSALENLENDRFEEVAEITLKYYDKSYKKGLACRQPRLVEMVKTNTINFDINTQKLITTAKHVEKMKEIKLTQYSHGAGCGCKIAPNVLTTILSSQLPQQTDANLIVGNDSRDDAAVYDLGDGTAVISTTDFFMPIVDDAFTFGQIAAVNALSDVYAMGGEPLLAIAILGWPVDKLSPELAQKVVDGGRQACKDAGIMVAGGHSIDSPEPIFGLAVTGRVDLKNLKQNNTAEAGCRLFLTKPLGVGMLTTAEKKGILLPEHKDLAIRNMVQLNIIGSQLAKISGVKAMTDVTGFSLMGHLCEMCEGSGVSAEIEFAKIPQLTDLQYYIDQKSFPGGTFRNKASYHDQVELFNEDYMHLVYDPQTSGGLLVAVAEDAVDEVVELFQKHYINAQEIGVLTEEQAKRVYVK